MGRSMATLMGSMVTEVDGDGEMPPIEALPSAIASSNHSYEFITIITQGCRPTFHTQSHETLPVVTSHLFLRTQTRKYSRSPTPKFSTAALNSIASLTQSLKTNQAFDR